MSKKQREKVEDEVRYHKEINSHASASSLGVNSMTRHNTSGSSPDTTGSVFDPQQPSSTDHMYVFQANRAIPQRRRINPELVLIS